ncbi:secreted NIS1 [Fusarium subglutinans]|uniref:Secreted NIS1 n=1 Tax=Gibberella subglutinans TaxID=42677 RepID=A0A8H5V8E9_GIBSU|nr:secreted NIS1 [Fusarium subglutinans]KAF5614341.1 secreted NIS1 [Fusarium subglutinans]
MRFSIAAASTALLALAEARITGIKVPKEIAVGEPFEAIIVRENYIQSVFDSSIVFGYAPESQYPGTIGQVADSFALGKAESNKIEPLKKKLTIPEGATKGKGLVTAALLSIYGASGSPTISEYNVTVTFGDKTSDEYASSS